MAIALFACASLARADALRLLAPANGSTLRGGSLAELRWSAAQLPKEAEEWEAFLSIDGGKYYAFRVTPHLDIDLQRFTFVVPNVDSRDARILIRAGNEAQETRFAIPESFSIVRDPNAELLVPQMLRSGHGEAAREGDAAVVLWTDGGRNGSGVTQQSSTNVPSPSVGRVTTITRDASAVFAPAGKSVAAQSIASTPIAARNRNTLKAHAIPTSVDLLLVCSRRNV